MENYQTMVDALNDLKKRGFTLDFNLANGVLHNSEYTSGFKLIKE